MLLMGKINWYFFIYDTKLTTIEHNLYFGKIAY